MFIIHLIILGLVCYAIRCNNNREINVWDQQAIVQKIEKYPELIVILQPYLEDGKITITELRAFNRKTKIYIYESESQEFYDHMNKLIERK
jgi:hypothetical protein